MKTSYFAKVRKEKGNLVSIAGKTPAGFPGRIYKKLAPQYIWWKEWHDNGMSDEWYAKKYTETVLDTLDAQEVYAELGEDAILCCYETPEKFCHRHLIAAWLQEKLGITVTEL